jgi:hypothetical protein
LAKNAEGGMPGKTLDEFLEAAQGFRKDANYRALLGSASDDPDPDTVERSSSSS